MSQSIYLKIAILQFASYQVAILTLKIRMTNGVRQRKIDLFKRFTFRNIAILQFTSGQAAILNLKIQIAYGFRRRKNYLFKRFTFRNITYGACCAGAILQFTSYNLRF